MNIYNDRIEVRSLLPNGYGSVYLPEETLAAIKRVCKFLKREIAYKVANFDEVRFYFNEPVNLESLGRWKRKALQRLLCEQQPKYPSSRC